MEVLIDDGDSEGVANNNDAANDFEEAIMMMM